MRKEVWYSLAAAAAVAAYAASRQSSGKRKAVQYVPFSDEATDLLAQAAAYAGLPSEWANLESTHKIMQKESKGWVGIPNYTFGDVRKVSQRDKWPEVWAYAASGQKPLTASTAIGLGQLIWSNADMYMPSGRAGYGIPLEEAIGYLRYIDDRYGHPDIALSVYGRKGSYVHPRKGQMVKKFGEGY